MSHAYFMLTLPILLTILHVVTMSHCYDLLLCLAYILLAILLCTSCTT